MTPSQLYSRILPFVPGCPEPTVDQAVMDAVIEFADRTQAIFTTSTPVPLVDGRSTYYVFGDYGLEPDLIRGVYVGPRELTHATQSRLHDLIPSWQTAESSEPTVYTTFEESGSITVYPKPRNVNGGALTIVATWSPGLDATSFPDELGRRYFRDLAEGAKARLMMMPDRKWTNPQLGAICQGKFDSGISDARIEAIHAKGAGSIVVRQRQFGS